MKQLLSIIFITISSISIAQKSTELSRSKSDNAKQAVTASKRFVFVINNNTIEKRNKVTWEKVAEKNFPKLHHLNSSVIINNKIYCAHSNYPEIPMHSSIEIFDTKTLSHIESHSFGIENGSCTWIDKVGKYYYVFFAHYANANKMQKNRDVSWSQLVKYDENWSRVAGWVLPRELLERVSPYSISGGIFLNKHQILATHHHHKEFYLLSIPKMNSELILEKIIPTTIRGQGISYDNKNHNIIWGINKKTQEVIKVKLED